MNPQASSSSRGSLSARVWRTAATLPVLILANSISLPAQPSGGPYGPIQQRYDVPKSKHVFYVAPDGKADASGTSLDQPGTLESVITRVVTGDAIILRGGTYRTGDLLLNQGITMEPYADERPILKGTEIASHWTALGNGLWRTSWNHFFPAQPADWWRRDHNVQQTPLVLFNNDMVFLDGKLLDAVGSEHELNEHAYFIDYENGDIYLGTDPTNHVVEITAHDSAIIRTIRDVHGKSNDRQGPVIRGITFTQYAYRALEVEGTEPGRYMDPAEFGKEVVGTTLENDTISFCSRVAGYFRGDQLVIRHCLVSDCGTEGIYVIDSADVLLEKNIITRTNSAEKITGYFATAVKIFNQSYRATCRDNLIIDNPDSNGVWYDVGEVDGVFVDNWVENTGEGFFFEISKGVLCAGNIFVNCADGIRILNSSNAQVYQNTFFNSRATIDRSSRSAVNDHFGWHPSAGPDVDERHGHVFANNLLVADETHPGPLLRITQAPNLRGRLTDSQVKELDGNVYVRRTAAKQPLIVWSPAPTAQGFAELPSLDALRKLEPKFAAHSQEFPDYWGPLFHCPQLDNFELLPAFPGAKTGVPLPDHVRDVLRRKSGAPAFPGAYAPGS